MTPITPSEREPILDALRGFAILGILLVNIEVMRGSEWLVAMAGDSVAPSALPDRMVQFAIGWLAAGKCPAIIPVQTIYDTAIRGKVDGDKSIGDRWGLAAMMACRCRAKVVSVRVFIG